MNDKKHECNNIKVLSNLIMWNELSRSNFSADLIEGYHKNCGKCIQMLMNGNCGVVSNNLRYLQELGKGKPGDDICLATYEYAEVLIGEELKNDINNIWKAEKKEREIRNLIETKRYEEKIKKFKS